ncbi:MAG: FAD-dependent oxidoreductase [Deltaproteobacteria bacterium]|nr:MAG: FAD-dependent oxidoreductase [Deltaproteobacteria bacterium]
MANNQYDLMIVGAGPGGITAALYGQRLGLSTVVFGDIPGGSVYMIENLANYPGFIGGVPGTQFGTMAFKQAQDEGAFFTMTRVDRFGQEGGSFLGTDVDGKDYAAPSAIVATGRVPKRLAIRNPNMRGIHFCSICDGPLFRGRNATLAVVGSDNAAGQHALSLSRIAEKVVLICRSSRLKMDAAHQKLVEAQDNIDIFLNSEVVDLSGQDLLEALVVSTKEGEKREIVADGVFLAIGWTPSTSMLDIQVETTSEGYIKTDERLMSSVPGLFAAGDVRDKNVRQVLTACADGARAATYAAEYLERMNP